MSDFTPISTPVRAVLAEVAGALIAELRAKGEHAKAERVAYLWKSYLEDAGVF